MAFSITYQRLFTVHIEHGYYLNQGSREFHTLPEDTRNRIMAGFNAGKLFQVIASESTARKMRGLGMQFRQAGDGFFTGIRIDPDAQKAGIIQPDILFGEKESFTFGLKLRNYEFPNFTGLSLPPSRYAVLYFSNRADNFNGGKRFLSHPVAEFDSEVAYESGDLMVDNAASPTQLFEAVRNSGPGPLVAADWREIVAAEDFSGNPGDYAKGDSVIFNNTLFIALENPTSNPPSAQWEEVPLSHQFVSRMDWVSLIPPKFSLDVSGAASSQIKVKVLKTGTTDLVKEYSFQSTGLLASVFLDFSLLEEGRYDLRIENSGGLPVETEISGPCYISQSLFDMRPVGIVDICHDQTEDLGEYKLVDGPDQELLSPEFHIRFRHRSTFWRYIFNREQTETDAQLGAFERDGGPGEKKRFKTKEPMPLTMAVEAIKKFDSEILLPNPGTGLIKPDSTDKQIYSEIYINS